MMINVEIISKETIIPSSPTPSNLKHHKLSLLDQTAPPSYIPITFFYHADQLDSKITHYDRNLHLKESLSEALTLFYPLAGIITQGYFVDCNDYGVEYLVAKVTCNLSQVIRNPGKEVLHKLLPFEPNYNHPMEINLAIQYNIFQCGGIAISVCITHKLVDGTSASEFVKSWATITRENHINDVVNVIKPSFLGKNHFPAKEIPGFRRRTAVVEDKVLTKTLVFNKSDIASLREKGFNSLQQRPTRVEAVSAFIWKRFMHISKSKIKAQKTLEVPKSFAAIHAVNLRVRMDPPLPTQSFGNLWWFSVALKPFDHDHGNNDYETLISEIRKSIKVIDGEFVKKLEDPEKTLSLKKLVMEKMYKLGEVEFCSFTSWCRFGLYESDFGWGKPVWVCSPSEPYKNTVVLMSTSDGDGIEAWVNLKEDDMLFFERDSELLPFIL